MGSKIAGVLPKNYPEPYKEPERPKRFEVEQASDGTYIISCYGGKDHDYMGKKATAKSKEEMLEKFEAFFSKSKKA